MDWITDRPPTKADADEDGDVIGLLPGGLTWFGLHWSKIEPGQAWLPFKPPSADPAPAAAPAPTTSQPRRIVSITESAGSTMAVADDGTAWRLSTDRSLWFQLPALPDREAK